MTVVSRGDSKIALLRPRLEMSHGNLDRVYVFQREITCIVKVSSRAHCRNLFRNMEILTRPSLMIFEAKYCVRSQALTHTEDRNYKTKNWQNNSQPKTRRS